ncbi:MAG: TonB-dependent receptor [Candidatus Sphingomonas phytovorans]|nr:TonB-dependent receptor [Sphingomonas sp.]WEK00220.1 MAG: TonB-dependent receptor [Sphingomonas sp.]
MARAFKLNLVGTSMLMSALAGTSLLAATAEAQTTPAGANPEVEGDIVVTARKRSERLQDTPVPVTVLNSSTLVARNQTRLQDYFAQVPGLSINPAGDGTSNIMLRGISTGNFGNPTVAVTIDDVPFGASTALGGGQLLQPDLDPAILSQIEVLRGPQGTLYGAASLGGLIKYVTINPSTNELSGRVEADISDTHKGGIGYGLRGSINVPVTPTLAIFASGFSRRSAGYVDNVMTGKDDVNSIDVYGGRLSLLWTPVSELSVKLSALYQHTKGDGSAYVFTDYYHRALNGDLTQSLMPDSGSYRARTLLLTANVDYDLGPATLSSVTGYGRNNYFSGSDYPAIAAGRLYNDFGLRKVTEELRLSSKPGAKLEWLIGAFYDDERTPTVQTINTINPTTAAFVSNLAVFDFPTTYKEYSFFGDATYHFTRQLSLQVGMRYSHNKQTYRETDTGPLGDASPGVPTYLAQDSSDNAVTLLVVPQYKISDDLMLYARFATGYRPGGPNASANVFNLPGTFGADKTKNYEAGIKGSAFDRQLTFDISGYHIDWNNIQVTVVDPATQFSYFSNGGQARSDGFEGSLEFRTRQGFRLTANASYNIAEFSRTPPPNLYAANGAWLPFAPRYSGSASADQDLAINDSWTASFGGTVTYIGKRYGIFASNATGVRVVLPQYTSLDLRAGIHDKHWTIGLFVQNVTDKRGVISSTARRASRATLSDIFYTNFIQPRTIGVSVARKF